MAALLIDASSAFQPAATPSRPALCAPTSMRLDTLSASTVLHAACRSSHLLQCGKGLRHPHRRSWLLFLGDSDTRSLVLELLQLIVAGQHGAAVAANDTLPWLGTRHVADGSHSTGRLSRDERNDWLRRCFLDFTYSRRGTLLASRLIAIRAPHTPERAGYITWPRLQPLNKRGSGFSNGDVELACGRFA